MAKTLNIIKGNLPLANAGLKLSKKILISEIEPHPDFQALFSIDEDVLSRITQDIIKNSYDNSQPVHIWITKDDQGNEHKYLIDGYTRLTAAKKAGLETVPYYGHEFNSLDEAYRYALHLQTDRRNLEGSDLLKNIEFLMGSEYIKKIKGNKNSAIGEILGVSEKTVERGKKVLREGKSEDLEAIENKEKTVNEVIKNINQRKQKNETTKIPNENKSEEKKFSKEYRIGFSKGFEFALCFTCGEIENGKTPHDAFLDILRIYKEFPLDICEFILPESEIIQKWIKEYTKKVQQPE